jgi:TetR/AcrR family transcriptional regulator
MQPDHVNPIDEPIPANANVAADVAPAERDERTRGRLLRAGVSVFDRKGYSAASVREIVEMAGVTKPALYYHFGSKEGLLMAVLEETRLAFTNLASQAVSRPGTARERLLALCKDLHDLFGDNVPCVRVAHAVFFGSIEGLPEFDFHGFERTLTGAVRQIVQDGQAAGEITPSALPEDVSLIMVAIIGTFAMRRLHYGQEGLDIQSLRRVFGLVFDGALGRKR